MPSEKRLQPLPESITSLSDKELAEKLQACNVFVGPILPTTRRVYQRKLFHLETGLMAAPATEYQAVADDTDSDGEQDKENSIQPEPMQQPQAWPQQPIAMPRQRATLTERTEIGEPSPRRPLHPGIGDYTPRPHSGLTRTTAGLSQSAHGATSPIRWWVIVLIAVCVAAFLFLIFRNTESVPVNNIPKEIDSMV